MLTVGFYCISNRKHLAKYAISYKGDCWDNTVAESFFHTLETGLTHQCKFKSRKESKNVIFEYIEVFYNRERSHSANNNLSPVEFEERQKLLQKEIAA